VITREFQFFSFGGSVEYASYAARARSASASFDRSPGLPLRDDLDLMEE
jgi:hypothetical protein